MRRPRLLDLFCGAGGCSVGYYKAGFDVDGVDIKGQSHYPFNFFKADALGFLEQFGHQYDAVHASPPCQLYSSLKTMVNLRTTHKALIAPMRELLRASGKPWVIENVSNAKKDMPGATLLCGTMFGLKTADGSALERHRLFECSFPLTELLPPCDHSAPRTIGLFGAKARDTAREKRHYSQPKETRGSPVGIQYSLQDARDASGLHWMTMAEISLAIPPAYTEWIGRQLYEVVTGHPSPCVGES